MKPPHLHLALIGDYNPDVLAHQAIPIALQQAADTLGVQVHAQWLATDTVTPATELHGLDGFWCVPASPYRDTAGALCAIRFAREQRRPFLGTCGGFQHAVLEYARNVLGWADAEHGELAPNAARAVIAPLTCSLVEATDTVGLAPYTRIAEAYGQLQIEEGYRCRYGVNPTFADALLAGALIASGHDSTGICARWSCSTTRSSSPPFSNRNAPRSKAPPRRWYWRCSRPARRCRHDRQHPGDALLRGDFHLAAHRRRSRLRPGRRAHARTGARTTGVSRGRVGAGARPGDHRIVLGQRSGDPGLETPRRTPGGA